MRTKQRIEKIYLRTLRNCTLYLQEGKKEHLQNEIGVLRGIIYAAEEIGYYLEMPDDLRKYQNERNKEDGPEPWEK